MKTQFKEISESKFDRASSSWFRDRPAILTKRVENMAGEVIGPGEKVMMLRRDKEKIGIDIISKSGIRINSVFYAYLKA